nr:hypothetical protein [Tanacetum cinerariifolium]
MGGECHEFGIHPSQGFSVMSLERPRPKPNIPMRANLGVLHPQARLLKSSKDIESIIESQRSDKIKDGIGYNAVPPPTVDLYLSPKKDLSWTGLPEFADDTKKGKKGTTGSQNNAYMRSPHRPDGHRPHGPPMKPMRPNMNGERPNRTTFNKQAHSYTNRSFQRTSAVRESTSEDGQNRNSSASENGEPTDSILSKPAVKFVKAVDRPAKRPTTNKAETVKKPTVKYAEMYRIPSKKPTKKGKKRTTGSQNNAYMRSPHRLRPQYRAPWVPTVNKNFPPVNRKPPTGNSNVSTVCCCCSRHVNTARPKAVINRRNRVKDVQASACWVWKPVKPNSASIILKRYDYVDGHNWNSEDKKKQRNKKLEDSEAEHQV